MKSHFFTPGNGNHRVQQAQHVHFSSPSPIFFGIPHLASYSIARHLPSQHQQQCGA